MLSILILYGITMYFKSLNIKESIKEWTKIFEYFVIFILYGGVNFKEKDFKSLVFLTVLGAFVSSLYALYPYFFKGWPWMARAVGPVNHPNIFSYFIEYYVFFLILFIAYEKNFKLKILGGIVLSLISFSFVLTQSRGAWIGVFLSSAVLFFAYFKIYKNKKVMFLFVLALIFIGIFPPKSLKYRIKDTFDSVKLVNGKIVFKFDALSGRNVGWKILYKEAFLKNVVFGIGAGGVRANFPYYKKLMKKDGWENYMEAHNTFLQWLVEGGIVGFMLWIYMFYLIIKKLIKLKRKTFGKYEKITVISVLFAFLAFSINGLTGYMFFDREVCHMFWGFLAILLTLIHNKNYEYSNN
jgi:O-antigen ligase